MFTTSKNLTITVDSAGLSLAENLLGCLYTANSMGDPFDANDGSYGFIRSAVHQALTDTLTHTTLSELGFEDYELRKLAERLLDEALDNGESIAYQIDLWNKDIIDLPDSDPWE